MKKNVADPIYHLDTEMAFIGVCLFDWTKCRPLVLNNKINPDSFYDIRTKAFFRAIFAVNEAQAFVDLNTVAQSILESNESYQWEANNLNAFGCSCIDKMVASHASSYCAILKKLEAKRNAQTAMIKALTKLTGKDPCETIIPGLSNELKAIYGTPNMTPKDEIARNIKKKVEYSKEHGYRGVPSRWKALQEVLTGYIKRKMIIIAARPSVGKTTFALNEMRYTGTGKLSSVGTVIVPQIATAMISLETTATECFEIIAAEKAQVDLRKVYDGNAAAEDIDRFHQCVDEVMTLPLFITDQRMDIYGIESWLTAMKERCGIEICWLDYIQIIKRAWDEGRKKDMERISEYSKKLFYKADELDIALSVLAQINREGEMPPDIQGDKVWKYIPRLKHLKNTGALEEDAYQAMILYPDPTDPSAYESTQSDIVVDVQKNKRGPKGRVWMRYEKDMQTFSVGGEDQW